MKRAALVLGVIIFAVPVLAEHAPAWGQQGSLRFEELPTEVRSHINKIRQACKWQEELDPDFSPYDFMQGVTVIDLDGDGSRDLMVDNEHICNGRLIGGTCSNSG